MSNLKSLEISSTQKTPEISCNSLSGHISIIGNCVPEDGAEFFKPMMEWILEYNKHPNETTELEVDLHYFNTSSSRILLTIFRTILSVQEKGSSLNIIWKYDEDDEDIKESGEDYQQILDFNITLESKPV